MYLLCGDPNLEDLVQQMHVQAMAKGSESQHEVYNLLRTFIMDLHECNEWKDQPLTVFIDTNPAMTIYTKVALCAADKLVTIVQPDDFSKEAMQYVTTL